MTSVFSLAILVAVLSGCSARMNVTEKMMWSTYPLLTPKGAASGFVINRHDPHAPGGRVPVIFTSIHVLETVGKGPLIIAFRTLDQANGAQVRLISYTPQRPSGKERFYVRHPTCDLAAFPLHLPAEAAALVDMHSSLDERVLGRSAQTLHAGDEVSFLGYPSVLPGTEGAFPVLRNGRVASYPVGTPQAHGRFLINSDVYPGDSGAPVFLPTRLGDQPQLIGSITDRICASSKAFSHLAVAVDVDVIRETMELLAAREDQTPTPKNTN